MKELFLDANAHIPINNAGMKAFIDFNNLSVSHSHPSGISKLSREASGLIEQSRATIAHLIGAESNQIIFTHNCTQAAEWAMKIWKSRIKNYSVSKFEHPAIQDIIDRYDQANPKTPISTIEINSSGELLRPDTTGSIIVLMQNEIGSIQPIKELKNQYLFSDMSQALGKIPVDVKELDVDMAIFGGHKFGGMGCGFIYLKDPNWWMEFGTGSRYYTDIPGTPFTAAYVATAAALQEAIHTLPARTKKMQEFQSVFESRIESLGLQIVGKNLKRSPNTTFITGFDGLAAQILLQLSERNISVGLGSACGSIIPRANRTLEALGITADTHSNLRISQWGEYGKEEANYVADNIQELLK